MNREREELQRIEHDEACALLTLTRMLDGETRMVGADSVTRIIDKFNIHDEFGGDHTGLTIEQASEILAS